jgi:hypothetical protein
MHCLMQGQLTALLANAFFCVLLFQTKLEPALLMMPGVSDDSTSTESLLVVEGGLEGLHQLANACW